jgi:hypothetical protein
MGPLPHASYQAFELLVFFFPGQLPSSCGFCFGGFVFETPLVKDIVHLVE